MTKNLSFLNIVGTIPNLPNIVNNIRRVDTLNNQISMNDHPDSTQHVTSDYFLNEEIVDSLGEYIIKVTAL